MAKESIIDTSKPNAGRIYDYLLGGHHNFEVDRQAAERLLAISPFGTKFVRLQRWCLQDIATELTERRGYDIIVDFASGLPTNDHVHHVVPEGTTVIYSDYDPVVVEYAHEILEDTPGVYFFEADCRRPEELLNRPQVREILGDERNVALVYWGIAMFLDDAEIMHAARTLYDWAGDESCWAFNLQGASLNPDDPGLANVHKIYEQMGTPLNVRSLEQFRELFRPWQPDEGGFIPLLEWHGLDSADMSQEELSTFGSAGAGYGVYLTK